MRTIDIFNRLGDFLAEKGEKMRPWSSKKSRLRWRNVDISEHLGIAPSLCKNWQDRNKIPWNELFTVALKHGCSMDYLLNIPLESHPGDNYEMTNELDLWKLIANERADTIKRQDELIFNLNQQIEELKGNTISKKAKRGIAKV